MESLPKQFVTAMRTLFDIMDDKHTGCVKLTDIENRWRDDRTKGLPRGVIESLQKVASHDGLLTFESFCTGLKICLLRNQVQNATKKGSSMDEIENSVMHSQVSAQVHRPPSAPLLDINSTQNRDRNWMQRNPETSTHGQHRTQSMPQLIEDKDNPLPDLMHNVGTAISKHDNTQRMYGPPKPPRLEKNQLDRKESEPWNEAHQERLELLKARVLELNRQLGALAAGWRHGPLSLHMNLALPTSLQNSPPSTPNNAAVLRSQNRMLAEEVNRKNERISVLEREKSALIRELLVQRNRTKIMDNYN
ncbi:PREDICTED: suppressor APC domain-containing protein 2 [Papilio polytes]|uniref:suppressor APC domain-containing protein 2 n=1 Tax=Papilio polytes TaxID=76194 RepID=UPI000676A6A4|nr:PREDICTED: suppressor APC domain-containing protein 2 [Papilio polytes]